METTGVEDFISSCFNISEAAVAVVPPEYNFSIFLLSSWAREKVMSTITNRTTTKFFSDKIDFIKRFVIGLQIRFISKDTIPLIMHLFYLKKCKTFI